MPREKPTITILILAWLLALPTAQTVYCQSADGEKPVRRQLAPGISVELSRPVIVELSKGPGGAWGVHQFPSFARLPDGSILVVFSDARDSMTTHGEKGQAFVSRDKGMTWKPYQDNTLEVIRPHFSVSEVYQGEYLVVPARPYMNWRQEKITLPKPVSEVSIYGRRHYYALEDMPPQVQAHFGTLHGLRYNPKTRTWKTEAISYDINNRIIVRYGVASKAHGDELLPQTFFERPLLKHEGELLYGDYRGQYRMADGRPPIKGILTCMASTDNGRSFQRRGTISADLTGENIRGEGCLAPTTDGRLVCVLRQQDQQLKPMKICWSSDKGTTWTESKDLCEFGVFPCIKLLNNGIMALSYGRPGVHLRFSLDGTGETWSDPITVVQGDLLNPQADSCGYTNLLALDDNSLLLTYNEMKYRGPSGRTCKAILVRRVTVNDDL